VTRGRGGGGAVNLHPLLASCTCLLQHTALHKTKGSQNKGLNGARVLAVSDGRFLDGVSLGEWRTSISNVCCNTVYLSMQEACAGPKLNLSSKCTHAPHASLLSTA
jgi:hypothetical protein